jgi:transcriptional regulator with XRE-family HTH domain
MAHFSSQDQILASVRQELIFQHLTEEAFGKKCGYSRKTISRIFNHPDNLSFAQLNRMLEVLQIEVTYLYDKK